MKDVVDIINPITVEPTFFRNLQDYIAGLDRAIYIWRKMGENQMLSMMTQV